MTQVHVIYHANCADGSGAAWAAHRRLEQEQGLQVAYHPAAYGDPPPETDPGAEVYILDFSYSLETMRELHRRHQGRVTLIDHHRTAQDELEGAVPNCRFDPEHSGACLAWKWWAGPGETIPELVRYIEDRDLWRWELRNSREVAAALDSYPKDFQVWDTLAVDALALEGEAILRRERLMVEKLIDLAVWRTVGGLPVPAVNTPVLVSETCEALLEKFPDAPFAAAYSQLPGPDGEIRERWSLRSRPGFDVSRTARRLGGGGHPQAAGFHLRRTKVTDCCERTSPDRSPQF